MSPDAIAGQVLKAHADYALDGVTFSGGEPMQQAEALLELMNLLQAAAPSLSFGMFSGYTERELVAGRYSIWGSSLPPEQRRDLWEQIRACLDFGVLGRFNRALPSRKTGRAGYSPACGNEWVRGICEKPTIKCSECLPERFLPITDDVIRWHLSGRDDQGRGFVMGVYPTLRDETCFFLVADFDEAALRADAAAFQNTCRQIQPQVAPEPSESDLEGDVLVRDLLRPGYCRDDTELFL